MENILIKNNENTELVTIADENDVLYYIEQYMGSEFAECTKRNLQSDYDNLQSDYDELKEDYGLLKTEFDSYESSLEDMSGLMHDTVDSLDEVVEEIETSKRLNKEKLMNKLNNLRRCIYNEL